MPPNFGTLVHTQRGMSGDANSTQMTRPNGIIANAPQNLTNYVQVAAQLHQHQALPKATGKLGEAAARLVSDPKVTIDIIPAVGGSADWNTGLCKQQGNTVKTPRQFGTLQPPRTPAARLSRTRRLCLLALGSLSGGIVHAGMRSGAFGSEDIAQLTSESVVALCGTPPHRKHERRRP